MIRLWWKAMASSEVQNSEDLYQYHHQRLTEPGKWHVFKVTCGFPSLTGQRVCSMTVPARSFLYLAFSVNTLYCSPRKLPQALTHLGTGVQIFNSVIYADCVFMVTILERKAIKFHKYKRLEHCIRTWLYCTEKSRGLHHHRNNFSYFSPDRQQLQLYIHLIFKVSRMFGENEFFWK